jgi:hypothetical protein
LETIFDYQLTDLEQKAFGKRLNNKGSYLKSITPSERLSDLHLLFLIRGDRENRERIIAEIMNLSNRNRQIDEPVNVTFPGI